MRAISAVAAALCLQPQNVNAQPEAAAEDEAAEAVEAPPAPLSERAKRARELFEEGRDKLNHGYVEQACVLLRESAALDPHVGTYGKLAQCEERRGDLWASYLGWLAAWELSEDNDDDRRLVVARELRRVSDRLPRIGVEAPPSPENAEVFIDGRRTTFETKRPIEPGRHIVLVEAPGHVAWEQELELAAGQPPRTLSVPALVREKPTDDARPTTASVRAPGVAQPSRGFTWWDGAALGTVAVGVAAVAGGAYFFGVAEARQHEVDNISQCEAPAGCPDASATREESRNAGNAATAFFIAGGALVAAGVSIALLQPEDESSSNRGDVSVQLVPQVSPPTTTEASALGLSIQGAF